jgi:hypothetical protein
MAMPFLCVVLFRVEGIDIRLQLVEVELLIGQLPAGFGVHVVGDLAVAELAAFHHQVALLDLPCANTELVRRMRDGALDHEHALRTTETPERRVRRQVRATAIGRHLHVRHGVAVGRVEERALHHRRGEVRRSAGVLVEGGLVRHDLQVLVETDLEIAAVRMPLAGHAHVVHAVHRQLHGFLQHIMQRVRPVPPTPKPDPPFRRSRRPDGSRPLPPVHGNSQYTRDGALHGSWPLRARCDADAVVLGRVGVGALCLDVEVLLAVVSARPSKTCAHSAQAFVVSPNLKLRGGMISSPFARASRGSVITGSSSNSIVMSLRACTRRILAEVAMISATGMPQKWISCSANSGSSGMIPPIWFSPVTSV